MSPPDPRITTLVRRLLVALAALLVAGGAAGASGAGAACPQWSSKTLLSGQGWLENLAFDAKRGPFVSALDQNAILRVSHAGKPRVLIADVSSPGGIRVRGGSLFFNTGDSASSGLGNVADGTIDRYRFKTHRRTIWARRLTMPNGLAFLPNGDAVVSRDLGSGTGITRVRVRDPAHPQLRWATLDDTNGLAVDPEGRWLYVNRTFSADSVVVRVRITDPSRVETVASLGVAKGPDDLTTDRRGHLLVAGFASGEVIRVDPATGATCVIAAGLGEPTSVRFGSGGAWPTHHLYVTTADGFLRELTPPKGSVVAH